jgi:AcrR family transcriptional regulator
MPRDVRKATQEGSKLDSAAWVQEALNVLAASGVDGVRVEIMARTLGVTKGSFYWHFKDRSELLDRVLQEWRRRATLAIIERLENSHESPERRLQRLLRLPLEARGAEAGAEIELSVRLWGRYDERALAVLREIDELRLKYIARLLEELGATKTEANARAILVYSYMRVSRSLISANNKATMQVCETILMGRSGR